MRTSPDAVPAHTASPSKQIAVYVRWYVPAIALRMVTRPAVASSSHTRSVSFPPAASSYTPRAASPGPNATHATGLGAAAKDAMTLNVCASQKMILSSPAVARTRPSSE